MSKLWKSYKTILVCVVVFLCSTILSACQYQWLMAAEYNGYDIDRIIYTDNVSKYITGKKLITEQLKIGDGNGDLSGDPGENSGYYYIDNGDGSIDVVFDTTYVFQGGSSFPDYTEINYDFGMYQQYLGLYCNVFLNGEYAENDPIMPGVLNSHKYWFSSGGAQYINSNYTLIHSDPDCTYDVYNANLDFGIIYYCERYNSNKGGRYWPSIYPAYGYGGYYEEGETIHIQYQRVINNQSSTKYVTSTFNLEEISKLDYYEVEELHNTTQEITKYVKVYILKKYYKNESGTTILGTTQEEYRNEKDIVIGYGPEVVIDDTSDMTFDHEEYESIDSDDDCPNYNGYIEKTFTALGNIDTLYKVIHHDCHLSVEYNEPYVDYYPCVGESLYSTLSENTIFNHITYNELVIDGIDFSTADAYMDSIIENAKTFDAWNEYNYDSLLDLNNYSHMFDGVPCSKITLNNIKGMKYEIKDLSYMFANCKNLLAVDFGNFFDTVQPTDISYMFYNCPRLQSVDLSGLDTSKVTNMVHMFDTNPDRNSVIDNTVNTPVFRQYVMEKMGNEITIPTSNNGELWTLDSLVDYFAALATESVSDRQKEALKSLFKCYGAYGLALIGNNTYPLTYDEFVAYVSDGECITLDEYLEKANADLSDDQKYTLESLKSKLYELAWADSQGIVLADASQIEELSSYMQGGKIFVDDESELDFLLEYSDAIKAVFGTDNGEPWTIETLATSVGAEKTLAMAYVKYIAMYFGGFNVKFTFDEAAIVIDDISGDILSLNDLWADYKANPKGYSDYFNSDISDLDTFKRAIKVYFISQIADDDVVPKWVQIYSEKERAYRNGELEFWDFERKEIVIDRDDYINNLINTEYSDSIVSLGLTETNDGEPWTWDTMTEEFIKIMLAKADEDEKADYEANPDKYFKLYKVALVLELMLEDHPELPVRYDEIVIVLTDGQCMSVEELMAVPKEDGTYYTREEILEECDKTVEGFITNPIVDKSDVETVEMISYEKTTKRVDSKLTLGGAEGNFCITNDMDTTDMFKTATFTKIVVPTIENGASVTLPTKYYNGTVVSTTFTSDDKDLTYTIYDESDPNAPVLPDEPDVPVEPDVPDTPNTPSTPNTPNVPSNKKQNANIKTLLVVVVPIGAIVVIGIVVILISQIRHKKSYPTNSDKIFEKAIRENKKIMLVLDTWTSPRSPETFARYVRAIKAYYGDGFVYYYKGVPNSPVNTSSDKAGYLESLGLIDVNASISTERLLMLNPDIYICGYASTAFQIVDKAHCGAIFNVRRALFGENYKNNVEFFITAVSSSDIKYGRIADGNDCCVFEFGLNDKYDIAIYSDLQNTLRFYKLNGTSFVEVER